MYKIINTDNRIDTIWWSLDNRSFIITRFYFTFNFILSQREITLSNLILLVLTFITSATLLSLSLTLIQINKISLHIRFHTLLATQYDFMNSHLVNPDFPLNRATSFSNEFKPKRFYTLLYLLKRCTRWNRKQKYGRGSLILVSI